MAGGPGTVSTTNDDLADLLEAVGGPATRNSCTLTCRCRRRLRRGAEHPAREPRVAGRRVSACTATRSDRACCGWDGGAPAARLVTAGAVVPTLRTARAADGWGQEASVSPGCRPWSTRPSPTSSPPPCPTEVVAGPATLHKVMAVMNAVVDADHRQRGSRSAGATGATDGHDHRGDRRGLHFTRLDGSTFRVPAGPAGQVARASRGRSR